MNTKDQKQLEVLYEQVVNPFSEILEQEEEYFEGVIDFYFNLFKTNPHAKKFLKGDYEKREPLTVKSLNNTIVADLGTFDDIMLVGKKISSGTFPVWVFPQPDTFSKLCKGDIIPKAYKIDSVYKEVVNFIQIYIRVVRTDKVLAFDFSAFKGSIVPVTESQTLRENFKKALIFAVKYFAKGESIWTKVDDGYDDIWREWRKEQETIQGFRKKFPEIEGIF